MKQKSPGLLLLYPWKSSSMGGDWHTVTGFEEWKYPCYFIATVSTVAGQSSNVAGCSSQRCFTLLGNQQPAANQSSVCSHRAATGCTVISGLGMTTVTPKAHLCRNAHKCHNISDLAGKNSTVLNIVVGSSLQAVAVEHGFPGTQGSTAVRGRDASTCKGTDPDHPVSILLKSHCGRKYSSV